MYMFLFVTAASESTLSKISVTLDFLQHIILLEESLFVDVDYLDETPPVLSAQSQLETETDTEGEQDCYGTYLSLINNTFA